jgi:hypothetical protein
VPLDGSLHYGWGYGRLGGSNMPAAGNAVYDQTGLPVWTPALGVKLNTPVAASLVEAPVATAAPSDWIA